MRPLHIRPPTALASPEPSVQAPVRVLVVDDVPEICQIFRDLRLRIREPKLEMTTEINSLRARELVSNERFDLVVSDYRMREVDGIEVLKAARASNPSGFRVLMTGYNEIPTSIARIREAQIDGYIQKPLRSQELLLLLLGFLNKDARHVEEHREQAREIEHVAIATEGLA